MNPVALIASIQISLLRRPLLHMRTVQDCLDKTQEEVANMIECGELAYAFDVAMPAASRKEPRVFALCVAEKAGWKNPVGATRNLQLPEVVNMILPGRDVRSTELTRLFSCSHQQVYQLAAQLQVTKKPEAAAGPTAYTVFSRASVAEWLAERRIV